MLGLKVLYASPSKLFAMLKMAKANGSYIKEITQIKKMDLLILDDFGMQPWIIITVPRLLRSLKTGMLCIPLSLQHSCWSASGMM